MQVQTDAARKLLAEMDLVVPWDRLLGLIETHYPKGGNGRQPYPLATMLRIHLMQNRFGYSDPPMDALPDETRFLNFRRLLERHALASKLFEAVILRPPDIRWISKVIHITSVQQVTAKSW